MIGELEKRINKWQDDDMMLFQLDMIRKGDILEIIDEMRGDMPKPRLSRDWGLDLEGKCKYWIMPTNKDWVEWFERWFGDKK